jgi:hypothetical protein
VSDVFISYARSTGAQARLIGDALRELGYGVWRDDELPAHRDYSEVIEERLRSAKAVVVVWSAEAVRSQWVRAEADVAREAGTLVQVTIDGAALQAERGEQLHVCRTIKVGEQALRRKQKGESGPTSDGSGTAFVDKDGRPS